jgi:hypothetical protein
MKPITILKKTNLNAKSSVHGVYDYGSNYAIALSNEAMVSRRGFHLNDEDIKNILHNLPKEFKKFIRFIDDESKIEWFNQKEIDLKEKLAKKLEAEKEKARLKVIEDGKKAAMELIKKTEEEEKVITAKYEEENKALEDSIDGNESNDNAILNENFSEYDNEQINDYRIRLKAYAKELGIKIHPATKNINKILDKIKDGVK